MIIIICRLYCKDTVYMITFSFLHFFLFFLWLVMAIFPLDFLCSVTNSFFVLSLNVLRELSKACKCFCSNAQYFQIPSVPIYFSPWSSSLLQFFNLLLQSNLVVLSVAVDLSFTSHLDEIPCVLDPKSHPLSFCGAN